MPSPKRSSHRLAGATVALAATLALALPSLAAATTVEVREQGGGEDQATLEYRGDPGGNEVTVAIANPTEASHPYQVELVDKSTGIEAGAHCKGSEAPGATVICELHRPTGGWATSLVAQLGAGDNSFDARQFNVTGTEIVRTHIVSGNGEDKILTGDTYDLVEPGGGRDEVHSGDGNDAVLAAATPDGDDVYDLGGGFDQVSYARRGEPITSDGVSAGGAGEHDQLIGVDALIGGSGNDTLVASETTTTLDGGPGDDTLTGGEEADTLYGGLGDDTLSGNGGDDTLYGGNGDDMMSGGGGIDEIKEDAQEDEADHLWVSPALATPSDGADFADGGAGGDLIELGPGDDRAIGGTGGDLIRGGPGNDEIDGGEGDDGIIGEGGSDRLIGGAGFDEILAGRVREPRFDSIRPVDTDRDVIDCGPNQDVVLLNRWDTEKGCEFVRLIPIAEQHALKRNPKRGTARLTVTVVGPGTLTGSGGAIAGFSRRVKTTRTESRTAVVVPILPRGAAKRALKRRGEATVRFSLSYRPDEGVARAEPFTVKLVGPPPPKPAKK